MAGATAIVIGGGPAGLTAAYELLKRSDVRPIVLEASDKLGGIARTERYKGNRIDIGGHRFFSKSDRVMRWWFDLLPVERFASDDVIIHHQGQDRSVRAAVDGPDPDQTDEVMLVRSRKSRIYYLQKFFKYPLTIDWQTIANLGLRRTLRAGASYFRAQAFPVRPERSLEDFLINRFGRQLYKMFFESYTEKVWGVPGREISAEWGAQRIHGLSMAKLLRHAIRLRNNRTDLAQKSVETSLIERFLYPKLGPGQIWELCGARVRVMGGEILLNQTVERVDWDGERVTSVTARDEAGHRQTHEGDYFLSTMPVKELVLGMHPQPPPNVHDVAAGLVYRDFVTVGLLVKRMCGNRDADEECRMVDDNWIYIQEPGVKVGRLQIFNNWSPYLVAKPDTVWLGLEYFCDEGDAVWSRSDDELLRFGAGELAEIGLIDTADVLDGTVIRTKKAYPAYLGTHDRFEEVRSFVDGIENLFLLGRNGMHRYNNQDHSMLTAMTAVDNICAGQTCKANVWAVNTERSYHEERGAQEKVD